MAMTRGTRMNWSRTHARSTHSKQQVR